MNKKIALSFCIMLVFFGCLSKPKPFNETGFFQSLPKPNISTAEPSANLQDMKIVCTLTKTGGINNSIYSHGSNIRSEYFDKTTNKTLITIIKGARYYMNYVAGYASPENCTWAFFSKNSFKNQNYSANQSQNASFFNQSGFFDQTDLFSNLPDCTQGNFSEEIFKINGTVCDLEIIIQNQQ